MSTVPLKKLTFIVLLTFSFSSCMMMMPAHMSDSMNHSDHASSAARIDKVCGNNVLPGSSFTYEYKGTNYYFDSEQCLTVFKNNPDHFLQKSAEDTHKKNMKTTMWIGGAIVMTAMMVSMMFIVF